MTITWYGQSCFRIEGKNASVLIDPFSKEIGLRPPRLNDNIFLVSHEHPDHNNVEGVGPEQFVIRGPGEYEKAGVSIEGILSYHDDTGGTQRGLNTIYVIRMDDLRLCHLGDVGQAKLTDEQIEAIGDVDILFVPVGGVYTINGEQAAGMVNEIEPKVIIPMHYKIPGLNVEIEGPEKFLKKMGIKPEEMENFKIAKKTLPTEEIKLVVLSARG